ncbi:acyl-CoA thioesterase [Bradymonas sediminis]|uniref:Acyl-CoA thioesterase n=1 Tax=Bradymonas sediminis TaxID=1548548 RepID=A0A2Z4FK55_9DELT|nr:hotdog domain-containing protein [Bradymonas sediminis]AWV89357.1 acyl-CoA thioesterase [Bradymonas sediminis]TDP73537.1 acyl-CoA thioesterase YciA [Bradymonas sediminis]
MSDVFQKEYHPESLQEKLKTYSADPMIRVVMMPKDTNALGSIFGGVILSQLDLAAGEEARKTAGRNVVTKYINGVDFIAPVKMGDWVSFFTRTEKVGNTSVVVRVLVVAHRGARRARLFEVTEAELVFVAVDDAGKPAPILRAT